LAEVEAATPEASLLLVSITVAEKKLKVVLHELRTKREQVRRGLYTYTYIDIDIEIYIIYIYTEGGAARAKD